ncbi:MAG: low specificity L-threonine aldolase, partial [Clostridia bacterium]|nr:low specificity L-threonine aldolase [Clostridia bacterium]
MISFQNDYSEGAHPAVLEELAAYNGVSFVGYGEDEVTREAREILRRAMGKEDAEIHFLVSGTQTNAAYIASVLRPWEGVISAETGHIAQHETGAVEASGHQVLTLPAFEGKLRAEDVGALLAE